MRILFADATEGFTPERKDTKPCGGILTSLTLIPRYLASKGHDVTVKSTFPELTEIDGVKYVPISNQEALPKWDVIVVNRNGINVPLVQYSKSIGAKVIWWLHDIVDMRYLNDNAYKFVDKIIALSEYCKYTYSRFYDLPADRFVVIPNGVDKSVFYPGKYEDRKKYRMLLASAPIKGFIPVQDTWTNIKRHFPSAELIIYSNQSLHGQENNGQQQAWLHEMEVLGAKVQRPVPQPILAEKMRESWALLMPNSYPEICSNLLLQAQASGLPVISSNIGSAGEFIKNGETGIISDAYPHDLWLWIKFYVEAVVKLFKDDELHKKISDAAGQNVLDWNAVGERWNEEILKVTQG